MAKRPVSIQQLLEWAYRDQMVHVARPEGMPAEAMSVGAGVLRHKTLNDVFDLGTQINSSVKVSFEADRDAYVVHAHVGSLGAVTCRLPDDLFPLARPSIDRSAAFMPTDVERDFKVRRNQLVVTSAIDGAAPDWIACPKIEVERLNGSIVAGWPLSRGRSEQRVVMQCVAFHGDLPWDVARARITYGVWIDSLRDLQAALTAALENFEINELLPPASPWA